MTPTPLQALLNEIPLGVVQIDGRGQIQEANTVARQMLVGAGGQMLHDTLRQMHSRASSDPQLIETAVNLGLAGEVRVLLTPAPILGGYLASLERTVVPRLRAESTALRSLLAAATNPAPPAETAQRALSTLASTLVGTALVLYEIDGASDQLRASAHSELSSRLSALLAPIPLDNADSLAARAAREGRTLHVAQVSRSIFRFDGGIDNSSDSSAMALPVVARGVLLGVLYVRGPVQLLGDGELRLVQGLADAVGALIGHAHHEATLAEQRASFESLINHLPDAIVEIDDDGVITEAGGRLEPIFGQTRVELLGQQLRHFVAKADESRLHDLIASGSGDTPAVGELPIALGGPTGRPCEWSVHRARHHRSPRIRAVIRDISARRALEHEVAQARAHAIQSDRFALIGQLAAGVAHEINNPLAFVKSNLSTIRTFAQLVANRTDSKAAEPSGSQQQSACHEIDEMCREALVGIERISSIVLSLKSVSRTRPNEKVRFDPGRAVSEAIMFFQGAKRQRDLVDCELDHLPLVVGEPGGLSQVVLNLLDNAFQAMEQRGSITVRGTTDGHYVRISVADTGPGISPEAAPHLFEPFFTTKPTGHGTGLGLYISHEIVQQLGGDITFTTSSAGTTFVVRLPVDQESDGS